MLFSYSFPQENDHEQIISDEEPQDFEENEDEDEKINENKTSDLKDDHRIEISEEIAKKKEPENLETTLFVSNIAFDTEETQFIDFFKKYGEVLYGKVKIFILLF